MAVALVKTVDPDRLALARAIEVKTAAEKEAAAADAALLDFEGKLDATRNEFYAAEADVEKATAYLADMLRNEGGSEDAIALAAARYGEEHPRDRVRAAEARLEEVRPRLALAQEGHRAVKTRKALAAENVAKAVRNTNITAASVERKEWPRLLSEAQAAFEDLFRRHFVLVRLARSYDDILRNDLSDPDLVLLRSYLRNHTHLPGLEFTPSFIPMCGEMERQALAPWNSARAQLLVDADAPIPSDQKETRK